MKNKVTPPSSFLKMDEARSLMEQGHFQESLVLALDTLLQALDNLRSSLLALEAEASALPDAAPPAPEAQPFSEPCWLPAAKPRVLH